MKKILQKIYNWFKPQYRVLYKTLDGRTRMYIINPPQHINEFGNMKEGRSIVGFRSFCFNREGIRSFRYDRIISLNKI